MWFADNIDKDLWKREQVVRRPKQALMMAREGRGDVERDYKQGEVYWGEEMDAKLNDIRGEGRVIRETYKKLMMQSRGEEDYVSDRI